MIRYLMGVVIFTCSISAFGQTIDFSKTDARVTYSDSTFWMDGVGPFLDLEINISGTINIDTFKLVQIYYDELLLANKHYDDDVNLSQEKRIPASVNIELNSLGGDVSSSLKIGRFIRQNGMNVIVPQDAECASACVFILAGGATRTVSGRIGIHRPFLETSSTVVTVTDVKKAALQETETIRSYLDEMNISKRLVDDMMVIPSNSVRWLSRQEIDTYGLGVDDPVLKEATSLQMARKYGLSRAEYEARWRQVQKTCRPGSPDDCQDRIMRGQ